MKKISILGLACLAVGSMSAQMQVVKDVEHQLKGDVTSYPKAIETLTRHSPIPSLPIRPRPGMSPARVPSTL